MPDQTADDACASTPPTKLQKVEADIRASGVPELFLSAVVHAFVHFIATILYTVVFVHNGHAVGGSVIGAISFVALAFHSHTRAKILKRRGCPIHRSLSLASLLLGLATVFLSLAVDAVLSSPVNQLQSATTVSYETMYLFFAASAYAFHTVFFIKADNSRGFLSFGMSSSIAAGLVTLFASMYTALRVRYAVSSHSSAIIAVYVAVALVWVSMFFVAATATRRVYYKNDVECERIQMTGAAGAWMHVAANIGFCAFFFGGVRSDLLRYASFLCFYVGAACMAASANRDTPLAYSKAFFQQKRMDVEGGEGEGSDDDGAGLLANVEKTEVTDAVEEGVAELAQAMCTH